MVVLAFAMMAPASPLLGSNAAAATGMAPLADEASYQVPPSIDYCTYLGGKGGEWVQKSVVCPDDGVHLLMATTSSDLPVNDTSYQTSLAGSYDIYVCKFSPDGRTLLHSTYIGGTENDFPLDMAVDGDGCAYIVGWTSSEDFPTTPGSFQSSYEDIEGFVVKLSADASRLEYSTFLGGNQGATCFAVAWDPASDACVVAGTTNSDDFPTTAGAYDTTPSYNGDAFVCGLSADGSHLRFSTFLGGDGVDVALCLALAGNGDLLVGGRTRSSDFPTTPGALQGSNAGPPDCFLSRLDGTASTLVASTYLGGRGTEDQLRVAEGRGGSIIAAGSTSSDDLPTSADAMDSTLGGMEDAFVAVLDEGLGALEYGSYIGGTDLETLDSLAVDAQGDMYLCGPTDSSDFPVSSNAIQPDPSPDTDVYLLVLDPTRTGVLLSTYLGGNRSDGGISVALSTNGTLHMSGDTTSDDFPVTDDAYQAQHATPGGGSDAFLLSIGDFAPPSADAGPDVTVDQHANVTLDGTGTRDNCPDLSWQWTFLDGQTPVELEGATASHTFHDAGVFHVTLNVTDATGNWAHDGMDVTVRDTTPPTAVIVANDTVDQGEALALDGTASTDNVGVTAWAWTVHDHDGPHTLEGPTASWVFRFAGRFQVELNATDARLNWGVASINVTVLDTEPPVAEAGPDVEVDQGATVTFDASGSTDNVGIVTWEWWFSYGDDPVRLEGPAPSFTFDAPGVYLVVLTVVDASNWATSDMMNVTVRDTEPPVAAVVGGPALAADQREPLTLDGSASTDNGGVVQWMWVVHDADGDHELEGEVVTHAFAEAGTFVVELTVADAAGNSDTTSFDVTVRDATPPVADLETDREVFLDGELTLDIGNSTDNVGIATVEWDVPDGSGIEHVAGDTYRFTRVGVHNLTLTLRDAEGNEATATVRVAVVDGESPVARAGLDVIVAEGTTVTLDGSASTDNDRVVAYTWWSLPYLNATGARVTWTPAAPGVYVVTLEVRDPSGRIGQDQVVVKVLSRNVTLLLGPFLDADGEPVADATVRVELNGTTYTGITDLAGWANMEVPRADATQTVSVVATKDGWRRLEFDTGLDDGWRPTNDIPPMEREEAGGGGWTLLVALVAVAAAAVAAVLWRRPRTKG